jgi:hypothetical protein
MYRISGNKKNNGKYPGKIGETFINDDLNCIQNLNLKCIFHQKLNQLHLPCNPFILNLKVNSFFKIQTILIANPAQRVINTSEV